MRLKRNIFQNTDWVLIALYAVLVLMGWLNIYAATYNEEHQSIFDLSQSYGKQMLWIGTSIILISAIMLLESKFLEFFSFPIYGVSLILLLAVAFFGKEIKGARSWFVIANTISIQPSEIAKFGTALALSRFLSTFNIKMNTFSTRIQAAVVILLPAVLILLQPDTGSTLVFFSLIFVLYREGLSGNILLIGVAAVILFVLAILLKQTSIDLPFGLVASGKIVLITSLTVIAGFIYYMLKKFKNSLTIIGVILGLAVGYILSVDYVFENVLGKHQQNRINELLGITSDPRGAGYNVHQSKIAIGSGGFSGKGFLQGTQTKFDFVPEQSTDFIFCTVGEEWGFLGSLVVILLFITLLVRVVFVAERQKSKFARIYGYCVASIFFFHFMVNIGMTVGLAPVIGIPLPFFSYGGSSLWSFTVLLFVFVKLDSERKHIL